MDRLSVVTRVIQEARRVGLTVEKVPRNALLSGSETRSWRRWLLLNGHQCQVVPSTIKWIPNPKGKKYNAVRIYPPRANFAEFVIHVVTNAIQGEDCEFYVIPRDDIRKDTWRRVDSAWLEPYRDAWQRLSQRRQWGGRRLHPAFIEEFPPHTKFVMEKAGAEKVPVILISRASKGRRPAQLKERLIIAGRHCQVMVASRLGSSPEKEAWRNIFVRANRSPWKPEFVIYVCKETANWATWRLFVVPRWSTMVDTTTRPDGWIADFEDAWHLLAYPSIPESAGVSHDLT